VSDDYYLGLPGERECLSSSPRLPQFDRSVRLSGTPMLFSRFVRPGLLPVLLSGGLHVVAAPSGRNLPPDPCVKIAGLSFVDPADAIACQKSFPFQEVLRQNVISVVSGVFDFFTFEDFYYNSPPPFQDSTKDIRKEIERINCTQYAVRMFSSRRMVIPLIMCNRPRPTMTSTWICGTSQRS